MSYLSIAFQQVSSPVRSRWQLRRVLLLLAVAALTGCGGSEADSDTQAAAGAGSDSGYDSGYEGDGGEGSQAQAGGGAYGGGSYGGGNSGQVQGSGNYGGGSYSEGGYEGDMAGNEGNMAGYGGGAGYGPSYDGGMEGSGMMGGYGGAAADPKFATAMQFVRQNCVQCHGAQSAKGDVRLDRLSANFEDQRNATLWDAAKKQLESGQMPPKAFPRRPDPRQQQMVVSWLKTSLRNSNFVPLEEQDYLSQAKYAFASGKEREAIDLLYAHTVAADDEVAQEVLNQVKWSMVSLRPALQMRFAVGAVLNAADSITDLKPLGSTQGGGGGGGYGGEGAGDSGGARAKTERTFQQLTGDLGEAIASKFEQRWVAGSLGTVFKDIEVNEPGSGAGMGGAGYGGASYAGGGYSGGGFEGSGYDGGMGGTAGGSAESTRKPIKPGTNIAQGLHFIGTGSQAELLAKAAELGVDGLFVFDIKVEQNRRTRMVNNDTRVRLITLDGKALAATSTINNVDVERNKMRGLEDDTLAKNTDRFFAMFDEKVRFDSLPSLKPEHAQSRMRQLIVDSKTSQLIKLFEARLYHSMGLLNSDELSKIYQIFLRGNEGLALASGTVDDRRLVLGEILSN
jgi:hypothetical protein